MDREPAQVPPLVGIEDPEAWGNWLDILNAASRILFASMFIDDPRTPDDWRYALIAKREEWKRFLPSSPGLSETVN